MPSAAPQAGDLARRLNLRDATALVVGAVIGSAIFLIPSTILKANPSPLAAMLVFLFAGILSYLGALAYAELGSILPATGGEYVYLREAWGPLAGFLCGWSYFLVVQTGGIAALAVGFATLLGGVLPMGEGQRKAAAVSLLLLLTLINIRGVKQGAWFGNTFTLFKVSGLAAMVCALASGSHQTPGIDWSWPRDWNLMQFATALVPVLWAYEGWNMVTFVSGEIEDPQRNVPRALLAGLVGVILVYLLSMWVYFQVLTVPEIVATEAVAARASIRVLGNVGGTLVTLTMLAALIGSTNACVLAAPRMYFAQSRDGLMFAPLGAAHPRFRTPANALMLQAVWAILLASSGTYEVLLSFCTFGAWIFYAMAVAGVIRLRFLMPDAHRGYRMWGYPWTPLLFVAVALAFVAGALVSQPGPSLAGLGLIASGVPFYFYWKLKSSSP